MGVGNAGHRVGDTRAGGDQGHAQAAGQLGVGFYAACAIGRVDPKDGMKPIVGYVLALLVGLAIVTAVPWISTGFL